ncbi:MAG: ABC transporter permease, partial [Exilibacterium sp.]
GVFSAGGSVFESELWTDARTLQSQFGRNFFQIMRVVLEDPGDVSAIEAFIEKRRRYKRLN